MKKVLLLMFAACSLAVAQPDAYIINNLAETLSKIDLITGEVQNHVVALGTVPNDIALNSGFLYVVNSISADIQKIDTGSMQTVADITLPIGSNPYSIETAGNFAYVSGWVSGKVYRINLISNNVDGDLDIGGSPEGILFYNDYLYIAQTGFNPSDFSYGQGRMAIVDASNLSLEREVNVGGNPQSIILAPDSTLNIICTGNYSSIEGSVYIFDLNTGSLRDSILIGGQPVSGVISRAGIGYLAAGGWTDHGLIFSYDCRTGQILHGPANPINTGLGVSDIALDSLGFIYSCDFGGDTVTKLSGDGQIVAAYGVGDGPQSIVILDDRSVGVDQQPELPPLPHNLGLLTNYPNPFNAKTVIEYCLSEGISRASIQIIDIQGRVVRNIALGTDSGRQTILRMGTIIWDGRNEDGAQCASGPYLARMIVEPASSIVQFGSGIKMMLLK